MLPHVGAKFEVGRIIAQAKVTNLTDASKFVQCGMLVDTPPRMKEPLLGNVILGQAQAAVDTLGHRLVPVPYMDMK